MGILEDEEKDQPAVGNYYVWVMNTCESTFTISKIFQSKEFLLSLNNENQSSGDGFIKTSNLVTYIFKK